MLESHELHMQNVVLHGNHGHKPWSRLPGCHTSCGLIFWGLFRESSHTKNPCPRPRPVSVWKSFVKRLNGQRMTQLPMLFSRRWRVYFCEVKISTVFCRIFWCIWAMKFSATSPPRPRLEYLIGCPCKLVSS